MKILHLSDPHFSHIILSPRQFLSKQWLGNLNYTLFRRQAYHTSHLHEIPALASRLQVDFVVISGDFTSTSDFEEFESAKSWVETFKQPTLTLPGNHDAYTAQSEREKRYYHYFPSPEMKHEYVESRQLKEGWWWIGLDCAKANNLINSHGVFRPEMDHALEKAIRKIPKKDHIIIGNHFPLYPHGRPAHDTVRADVLLAILHAHPNVRFYLHGHDHKPYIIDDKEQPIVLNPGSIATSHGSCYLLELEETTCHLSQYVRNTKKKWVVDLKKTFNW